jgi:parallel beta-helix repeat protein
MYSFAPRLALTVLALAGLVGCRSDRVSPTITEPSQAKVLSAGAATAAAAAGGTKVLVVDDNRLDCPKADYTTIQDAVTAAEPGSTILVCAGTYNEWVVIENKNDLRLLAKGAPGAVVLDGQNTAGTGCSPASVTAFHCAGFELRNADGNTIEGFVVEHYWEAGIWLRRGSDSNTVRKNVTTGTPHHDGIQVAGSANNLIEQNTSFDNFAPALNACGINLTFASSNNIVRHNESFGNDFGIQVNASVNNVIFENESHDNRNSGMRNIGTSNGTLIENNRVLNNAARGISITTGSSGVLVARNKAFDSGVADLFWDGTGAVEFENNHCSTSVPTGLCEHTEGAAHD